MGKLFNLPTILSSSAKEGPNGPLHPIITKGYANVSNSIVQTVNRPGQIDAWDNP